jgi:membrane protease YdiL (CAAX protease family)
MPLIIDSSLLDPIYQIGIYLLTALLIWVEIDHLSNYHIDKISLFIIIIFKPVQTIILLFWNARTDPLALPNIGGIIIWIISLGLLYSLVISHPRMAPFNIKSVIWIVIGIIIGLLTSIPLSYIISYQLSDVSGSSGFNIQTQLRFLFTALFYQLGYAAISEEPLFRGFLWGLLKNNGWKDGSIFILQILLFMIAHIYYISEAPIMFWFVIPIYAIILGLLVWKSRTIASSLAAHSVMNAFGYFLDYYFLSLR